MTHKRKYQTITNLFRFTNIKPKKRKVVKPRVENDPDESEKENAVRIFDFQCIQVFTHINDNRTMSLILKGTRFPIFRLPQSVKNYGRNQCLLQLKCLHLAQ
jgi:hypothetical protein